MSEALGAACDHDCAVIVSDEDWHRSEGVCEGCGVRMKNYTETGWGPLLPFGDVPCGSRVGECCPPHKFTNEGAPDVCDTCGAPPHSTPPPTREPIRLTAEERKRLRDGLRNTPLPATMPADYHYLKRRVLPVMEAAIESILAARLAGGPTLADAWDAGYDARDRHDFRDLPGCDNPYRTPESEDTE